MTGTIKPLVPIKYCDSRARLKEYCDNITKYISNSNFDVIIFAENSGYDFNYLEYEKLAKSYGKIFEFIDASDDANNCNMSTG